LLISVGWVPPYRCPSRRLLRSRGEGCGLITRSKIAPIPGPRLRRWLEIGIMGSALGPPRWTRPSGGQGHEPGGGPGEGGLRGGKAPPPLFAVFAGGGELPIPFAQADLRLPADRLDLGGQLLQP